MLLFLVEGPASADLELVRALCPGDVVANLVTVGGVDPRPAGDLEIRPVWVSEANVGNALQGVRSGEQAGVGEIALPGTKRTSATRQRQTRHSTGGKWSDINAVPVVVKGYFVDKRSANRMCGVDNGAVAGIVEGVSNRG